MSPDIIWQCWPAQCENTPMQNLEGIRQNIVRRLDEAAMRCPSSIAWDRFAFPQIDQEFWREEALCYHPGKMLNVRVHMMGFRLMLQDDKGNTPTQATPSSLRDQCWFMTHSAISHMGASAGSVCCPNDD